ncbi:putative Carbonic anhydrase [Glarea lozoyensis 74030]|uniref:Carbonic anhydrase n=1 Tax=Glarea lozoyensis (strain ATCC 74030 / MF5533) TaxID=1104152 RepID=H0ERE9_GLAL7|nr:putative Carbonic anhydrase [Glarea lozoyensis 74030]
MLLSNTLVASALIVAAQACTELGHMTKREAPAPGNGTAPEGPLWAYGATDGPMAWYNMDPEANKACGEGLNQTPIDLNQQVAKVEAASGYPLKYGKVANVKFSNTHHTAQVQVDAVTKDNTLQLKGEEYYLAQFHFHVPSEHHIEGEMFPIEVHFVHKTKGMLNKMNSSMMIGCENYPLLNVTLGQIAQVEAPNSVAQIADLDLTELAKRFSEGQVFRYLGSLTTPPCTEGVEWLVSTQVLTVDVQTYNEVKRTLKYNSRYIQANPGTVNIQKAVPGGPKAPVPAVPAVPAVSATVVSDPAIAMTPAPVAAPVAAGGH